MDAEFDRAEKRREKERKDAEKQRKLREEQDRKSRRIVEEAEERLRAIQKQNREKEERRRLREEEEALLSGGITFARFYRPVPMANLETDKIKLPPSALEQLSSTGAIESGRILAFELALFDDATDAVVSKTNCGVLEFTAAEGTVEVPVKAAMSLTQSLGEAALTRFRVRVRYVSIERFEKIRARVQPLGQGFHTGGAVSANVDLKSVLERVLSKQTIISEGDWIPVRHEGQTYILAVRELSPEPQAVLINTDVEIDVMPSEEVEKEIQRTAAAEKAKKERQERSKMMESSLPSEPAPNASVTIRARLPESITSTRRFDPETPLRVVFDWAESLLGNVEPPARATSLEIVQSLLPGQAKVFDRNMGDLTLRTGAGFGRVENLNFRWKVEPVVEGGDAKMDVEETRMASSDSSEEWTAMKANAESALDKDLIQAAETMDVEVSGARDDDTARPAEMSSADMFRLLVANGAEPTSAAKACHRYMGALRMLKALNLLEKQGSGLKAVELVEKFKGSTERVADAMMAWSEDASGAHLQHAGNEQLEHVQEASGSSAGTPPSQITPQWSEQISMLESMFVNKERSEIVFALEKHGGSVQLAVNELLS